MNSETIERILAGIVHPESGADIVGSGIVRKISAEGGRIDILLDFGKRRDPFAAKIRARITETLAQHFPQAELHIDTADERRQSAAQAEQMLKETSTAAGIGRTIAIASGKGGVGKSTVTSNLAVSLAAKGYNVAVLDADVYGPSQAKMFGAENYLPSVEQRGGVDCIVPFEVDAELWGGGKGSIKLISIAMFVSPDEALMWRGAMVHSVLRQLIHQTLWGEADYLLVDLPPGTGDIHLSLVSELTIDGAVVVSTPQQIAVADAVKGVDMFRHPNVNVPVLGIIENMSWFSPAELPQNRYYIFGSGGAARFAKRAGIDLLGEVPIVMSIMEGGEIGRPAAASDPAVREAYEAIAERIVEKLPKKG